MAKFSDLFPGISSFFRPEKGYKKAADEFRNFYNQGQSYLQPYNTQGQNAYPFLSGAMEKLLNPAALEAEFLQSYKTSPSAKYAMEDALYSGRNALNSMGMLGSSPALRAMQEGAARIAEQDRMNYLDRLTNKYLQGAGVAQNLYGTGASVASQLGQNAFNAGNTLGNIAYNQYAAPGQLFGGVLGTAAGFAAPWNMAKAWSTFGGNQ